MDAKDFRKDFLENVKVEAAASGEGSCASFVGSMAAYLIDAEVLPDFEPAFYSGIGNRRKKLRIDGYIMDEFDNTMNLIIADYLGNTEETRTFGKPQLNQELNCVQYFIEEIIEHGLKVEISTPCADLVDSIKTRKEFIRKYKIHIFTDGSTSSTLKNIEQFEIEGTPAECQVWDIERIFRICSSDSAKQEIEIDFKDYTKLGIPCLEACGASSDEYESYLCIIPGEVLANIYDKYGSMLLEGNVRSFLSTKVAVNKKIRETILKCPERFFAYNNGVSATAMDISIEQSEDGRYITSAHDFQIINGGQTTASLSNTRHKDKANIDSVYVQMKLTKIGTMDVDKSTELIRNISRSSNSQNKVSDADFFSTHPFHVEMENISRRIFAPAQSGTQYETKWFYERARGQYLQAQMRMTKAEKKKFQLKNPKKQVITKTDFAKVRNSWDGLPYLVSKGAQTNFVKFAELIDEAWQSNPLQFNEKYFTDTISLMILFKHIESLVPKQSWYEQGYRANIVTYSLAILHRLIKTQFVGYDLDLQMIWNKQEVPEVISKALCDISHEVYKVITDENRETINVTQWCKREKCWKNAQKIDINLQIEVKSVLIDHKKAIEEKRVAKQDQKVVSGIEAQTKVVEYSAEQWEAVFAFANAKGLLTPKEMSAIKIAMKIPLLVPDAEQSERLLKLLDRVVSEGLKI